MNKFWLLVLLLLISVNVFSQPERSEESFQKSFRDRLERAMLTIKVPNSFSDVKMKDCNYGRWACARTFFFNRVLINHDSTVVIALELDANSSWISSAGEPMSTKTDWTKVRIINIGLT